MKQISIYHHQTGDILFQGRFPAVRECVEAAIAQGTRLDYADLRHADLSNAALDNARMSHALCDYANLNGANMSEGMFESASFVNVTFFGACLCESDFRRARFEGALFGGTDIYDTRMDYALFSTDSALLLPFGKARSMQGCAFRDITGRHHEFSAPPITIFGLRHPVSLIGAAIKTGASFSTMCDPARTKIQRLAHKY